MNSETPLVTIMIATKDRPDPLRLTLVEMRKQDYPRTELLVIDDGSSTPVEPVVREVWPDARVIRHETSQGQCARRNEGFQGARGEYVLQLDDDCSFLGSHDVAVAVRRMRNTPSAGAFAFYLINSPDLPARIDNSGLSSGCVASFVGAAVMFRKEALQETVGYRAFFGNDWEEEELAIQLLDRGWRIVFVPEIVAHHRLSLLNRNSARTWMRGLRNRLWSVVIHMPARRIPFEFCWKIGVGFWDAVRLLRFKRFFEAMFGTLAGLPRAWSHRKPLSPVSLRRYDALRLHAVLSPAEFEEPPMVTWKVVREYARRWLNRARNRSVWHAEAGKRDVGSSYTVAYAHEEELKKAEEASVAKK